MTAPLTRAVHGRAVAGVCAGLAGHLSLPVTWVRVGLVVLSLMGGAGLVFYAWLWIFLPSEHEDAVVTAERVRGAAVPLPPSEPGGPSSPGLTGEVSVGAEDALRRRALWNGWQVIVGVVVLAIAVVLGLQTAGIPVSWGIVGPGGVVLLGMAVAWLQLDSLRGASRRGRVVSVLQVVVGLLLVAAPWALKAWRDHMAERTALAAQTERAEMAAHLHDSVLQSLALIQKNAEDPARVARYARAQERELRQYLYQDPSRPTGTLGERLEELAETLEERHGHSIEVVTVGTAQGAWLDPLLQAAQEAMRNGVRHAGPVRVYAEAGPDGAEVFVRDRGTGFDLDAVPADRLGVRESIIGRMQRSGGTAQLRTGPDGTEVRLHQPRPAQQSHPTEQDRT